MTTVRWVVCKESEMWHFLEHDQQLLAVVVEKVYNTIHWINLYPLDSVINEEMIITVKYATYTKRNPEKVKACLDSNLFISSSYSSNMRNSYILLSRVYYTILVNLLVQLIRALHQYPRGQSLKLSKPEFFQANCISGILNCDDHFCIYFFIQQYKYTKFIHSIHNSVFSIPFKVVN